jgi:hypothetical protein
MSLNNNYQNADLYYMKHFTVYYIAKTPLEY